MRLLIWIGLICACNNILIFLAFINFELKGINFQIDTFKVKIDIFDIKIKKCSETGKNVQVVIRANWANPN